MTREEWIKAANADLNEHANATFNISNWLKLTKLFMEQYEEVVFTARNGKQYTLTEIIEYIQKSLNKIINSHQDLSELSKGLIYSVPEDIEIKDRISLYE